MSDENASEQANKRQFDPSIGAATQFKAGQSGNPGGRPKRKWLTELHDELLEEKLSDPTFREQYKEAQWAKMLKGNVVAAMTLDRVWERTEGKLPTNVAITGELNLALSDRMAKAEQRLLERQQAALNENKGLNTNNPAETLSSAADIPADTSEPSSN